jgi:hypothetical protein
MDELHRIEPLLHNCQSFAESELGNEYHLQLLSVHPIKHSAWRTVTRPIRGGLQAYSMPCEPGNLISPRRLPSLSQHEQHFLPTAIAFSNVAYINRFNQICTYRVVKGDNIPAQQDY